MIIYNARKENEWDTNVLPQLAQSAPDHRNSQRIPSKGWGGPLNLGSGVECSPSPINQVEWRPPPITQVECPPGGHSTWFIGGGTQPGFIVEGPTQPRFIGFLWWYISIFSSIFSAELLKIWVLDHIYVHLDSSSVQNLLKSGLRILDPCSVRKSSKYEF